MMILAWTGPEPQTNGKLFSSNPCPQECVRNNEDTNVVEKGNVNEKVVGSVTELASIKYLSPLYPRQTRKEQDDCTAVHCQTLM